MKQIELALFAIIKREADGNIELMKGWEIKAKIKHPQQKDNVNCGVFTVLSSIRAMTLIRTQRAEELWKDWHFLPSKPDLMKYRMMLSKILLNDEKETQFQEFLKMFEN